MLYFGKTNDCSFSDGQLVPVSAAGQGVRLLEDEPEGAADKDGRRFRRAGTEERSRDVSLSAFVFFFYTYRSVCSSVCLSITIFY